VTPELRSRTFTECNPIPIESGSTSFGGRIPFHFAGIRGGLNVRQCYNVCAVSSSFCTAESLADHLSGTDGKYLSMAVRNRALSGMSGVNVECL
jgi:hypothetical protein